MIDNMNHGGRIAMLGLRSQPMELDLGKVVTHTLTLKGIYGREPSIVAATLKALDLVENSGELRSRLFGNAALFRSRMTVEGFELLEGEHAIIPVMFGNAVVAARMADHMLGEGVFVTASGFPVVPRDAARIRVQLSAAHSREDVERCVQAFVTSRPRWHPEGPAVRKSASEPFRLTG